MPPFDLDCRVAKPNSGAVWASGKFFFSGNEKLYLRGVTYGPLCPGPDGSEYGEPTRVERDFAAMVQNGINVLRTYTVPPAWFMDCAERHGLRLLVGLPWEQHVAFLDDQRLARAIQNNVAREVRCASAHPAVLGFALGNEIPSAIVRWHGRKRVERFLAQLYSSAKEAAPSTLLTYVSYPSTEYLQLPFIDFVCFNVYLEVRERLDAYLARLQNIAGDRPLVLGELGLDSRRHGASAQADSLSWQLRCAFEAGAAGLFVFAWTDEWHRGGEEVLDWDFGLTDRARKPKPALVAVRDAYREVPISPHLRLPSFSVIVCTYNGARTLRDCLRRLSELIYPSFEIIVVDDGSTDDTAEIARACDCTLIRTANHGLSSARNTGLEAASGELIAYIDDDAYPDPHWLQYLALTFISSDHAGVGGPNVAPCGDGPIAECVANSPGGPVHVLLSDRVAEHIPGCNMAFRRSALLAIGGFDPQFRAAGDDVDACWRMQERGWTLGFSPAALVWHHRRNSLRAYLRQQRGYGKAEALLERKWPEKYNELGHLRWSGRVYGPGLPQLFSYRTRIYHGTWGSAPFQSIYEPAPSLLYALTLTPEWYLVVGLFGMLALFGALWRPLLWALPLFVLGTGTLIAQALFSAAHVRFRDRYAPLLRVQLRMLIACMHLLQPLARLHGRLANGLTPWRRGQRQLMPLLAARRALWSERYRPAQDWLGSMESALRAFGAYVRRGGAFDRWDLEMRAGVLSAARVQLVIEEHGGGKQLLRFRLWPRYLSLGSAALLALVCTGARAALDDAWLVSGLLAGIAALFAWWLLIEHAAVSFAFEQALGALLSHEDTTVLSSVPARPTEAPDALPWEQPSP